MLTFDIADYIPLKGTCPTPEQWVDIATTARATRNAWFKSLNEWYKASTTCLTKTNPCYRIIVTQYELVYSLYKVHTEIFYVLTQKIQEGSKKTDIENVCNKYRKVSIDLRCGVKKLMLLVDGDTLEPYIPQ